MNIEQITNEIDVLENSLLTSENIRDLASLYVIKSEYQKVKFEDCRRAAEDDSVSKELTDIFPSYKCYVECKTEYQIGKSNEEELIKTFKLLCQEISEFLLILYSTTDKVKERKILKGMMENIFQKIC